LTTRSTAFRQRKCAIPKNRDKLQEKLNSSVNAGDIISLTGLKEFQIIKGIDFCYLSGYICHFWPGIAKRKGKDSGFIFH